MKEGHEVLLVGAPEGLEDQLHPRPPALRIERVGRTATSERGGAERYLSPGDLPEGRFDVVLLFCPREADLVLFSQMIPRVRWNGGIWTCWPKKSSPLHVDLAESQVRQMGLASGLVDNKICAVTEDWSGLRFVVRKEDRPKGDSTGGPSV